MSEHEQYIRTVPMVEIATSVWIYDSSWKTKHKRRIKYIQGKIQKSFSPQNIIEYAT